MAAFESCKYERSSASRGEKKERSLVSERGPIWIGASRGGTWGGAEGMTWIDRIVRLSDC